MAVVVYLSCSLLQDGHWNDLCFYYYECVWYVASSALMLLVGWQEGHPAVKKIWGDGGGGHWLVRMEWRPAGWSVCLPLLIFPCTIKSRGSLLEPAHPGGPGEKAIKRLQYFLMAINSLTKHLIQTEKGRDDISGEIHLRVESYLGSEVSSQTVQDATFRFKLPTLDFIEFMLTKLADVRHARLHQLWVQSHVCTSTPLFTATTNWLLKIFIHRKYTIGSRQIEE